MRTVVREAIAEVALTEAPKFNIAQTFAPMVDPQGNIVGLGPAWMITIAIKNYALGGEDIPLMVPVPGLVPSHELFKRAAQQLYNECVEKREQLKSEDLTASAHNFVQEMRDKKAGN